MTRATMLKPAGLLLCSVAALVNWANMDGAEFGSGQLTAALVMPCLWGGLLFLFGAVLAVMAPRASALPGAVAGVMCLPLYAYLLAPRLVLWLSAAASSVAAPEGVVANGWAIAGVVSIGATAFVSALGRVRR